jgi:O-antigen ligase
MGERLMNSSDLPIRTARTRRFWEVSVLVALGLIAIYATTELENPWIVLIIVGVLTFVLLVPNFAGAAIAHPVRLLRSLAWWQILWFVMLMGGLVFRARTASEISQSPVDGLALFRISCMLLVAAILFLRLTLRRTNWLPFLFSGLIGIFSLFGVVSLLSTVWSVNPPWTLYKSVEFLTDVAVVAAIVATLESVEEYKKFVNWTWIMLGLLVASAWIGALVDPSDALFGDLNLRAAPLPFRLQGVMPAVPFNELSEISAILALISLCRIWMDLDAQSDRNWYRLLFFVSIITLVITQTRGAYASFLVGLVVLLVFARRYWILGLGGILASGGGAVLLVFTNFGARLREFLLRGETTEAANGLSGRLEVWQLSIQKILERPLTGYGGFAGARFAVLTKNTIWSDAANLYIDAMLNIGVLGLLLLLVLVALVGWQLLRSIYRSSATRSESYLAMELFLAYTIIAVSSMESGAIITHPMLSFLVLLAFAEFIRRRSKIWHIQPQPI